jgi:ribosomal protein S18 acetylase RimI-like enzyme
MNFKLATATDTNTILTLIPMYYAFDHLKFDEAKARSTLHEFFSSPEFGRLWLFVDESTKQAIGYIIITFGYSFECGGKEAFVDELFVLEQFRGQGLGKKAIKHAQVECKKLGLQAMRLEVTKTNLDVINLYQKMGFNDLGRSLLTYWINPEAQSTR